MVLVALPAIIDPALLKDFITRQIEAATGRTLTIEGPVAFRLLPRPSLTAHEVRLANPLGAVVPDAIKLRAVEIELSFWPLLTGKFETRTARLVEPEIDLEPLPGQATWLPSRIGHLAIENGAITWRKGASIERLEHINATLGFDEGMINLRGTLVARGLGVSISAESALGKGDRSPFHVTLTTRSSLTAVLDGTFAGPLDALTLDAALKIAIPEIDPDNLASLPFDLHGPLLPLSLTGHLTASSRGAALEDLAIDLGSTHADGRADLTEGTPPHLAVTLALHHLDLDRWTLVPSLALPRDLVSDDLVATIALNADGVIWHGGLIREAKVKADLAGSRIASLDLAAELPGGTHLMVTGAETAVAPNPEIEGRLALAADDLRALLSWLGIATDGIPVDRLHRANLASGFTLAGHRLELGDITATLDATRISAAATLALGPRPAVGLRLAGGAINLDAYLVPGATAVSKHLADIDANIEADFDELTWHGEPLHRLHLDGTLIHNTLNLKELTIADLGGATARATGTLEDVSKAALQGELTFALNGPESQRAFRLLGAPLADLPRLGAFTLEGGVSINANAFALDGELKALGGTLHLVGDAGDTLDLALEFHHPSAGALLHELVPGWTLAGDDPGGGSDPLMLKGRVGGSLAHLVLDHLEIASGDNRIEGRLDLDADLTSAKASPADLASHLGGNLSITIRNHSAPIREAMATYHIAQGVAESDDLMLLGPEGKLQGGSVLDLALWSMRNRLQSVAIDGPLDLRRLFYEGR